MKTCPICQERISFWRKHHCPAKTEATTNEVSISDASNDDDAFSPANPLSPLSPLSPLHGLFHADSNTTATELVGSSYDPSPVLESPVDNSSSDFGSDFSSGSDSGGFDSSGSSTGD